jgi:hypothetical protein
VRWAASTSVTCPSSVLGEEVNPGTFALGSTWNSSGVFGAVGENKLEEYVRNAIRDETDQFVNAYLAANPKH